MFEPPMFLDDWWRWFRFPVCFRCFWKFTVADCKIRCCEVQTRSDKRFYLASDRDESGSHSSQKHAKALFVSWSVSMCVYIYTYTMYIYITGFLPFMKRIRVPKLRSPASSGLPGPPASSAERISQSQVLGWKRPAVDGYHGIST